MPALQLLAPAKLNLGLEVLARRSDGYHDIQTVFLPLRLYDRIEIEPRTGGFRLDVGDSDLPEGEDNLIARAARAACRALAAPCDLSVRLQKNIPVAAGLGGGSSDAAAVLLGIDRLSGGRLGGPRRAALAAELGADVPFFLEPVPAVGRGIGDRLEKLDGVPAMHWVLIAFPFGVSTPWAYRRASAELTLPREGSSIAALLGPAGVSTPPRNDLEPAVGRLHPEIRRTRRALERAGAAITGMSGSGPTVYGRFASEGEARTAASRMDLSSGARALVTSSPASDAADWDWGVAKW